MSRLSSLPRVLLLGPSGAGCSSFLQGFTDAAASGAARAKSAKQGEAPVERKLEWGSAERAALLIDRAGPREFEQLPVAAIVFVIDASAPGALGEAKQMLEDALARVQPDTVLLVLANKRDLPGALSVPEVHRRLGLAAIAEGGRACHIEGSSLAHAAGASADESASHSEDFAARGVDWLMSQLHGEDPLGSGTDHGLRGGDNTSDEEEEDAAPAAGQSDELYGGRLPHLPCVGTALTDYLGTEDGELSFRFTAGQQLVLYDDKGGVVRGSLVDGGRLGAFPKNVVEVSEYQQSRAAAAAVNGGSVLAHKPQILCLLLGLLGAGKSTLLARLRKPGARVNRMAIAPTLSFTPESFEMGRVHFGVYDLGRGEQLQAKALREQARRSGAAEASQSQQLPWSFTAEQAQSIIFVVDSADPARLDEARQELLRILVDSRLAAAPLLILASKTDLPAALPVDEVSRRLKLDQLPSQRKWRIEACSVRLVGDAQTPVEPATPAPAATSASSNSSSDTSAERKQCESESKIDDAAATAAGATDGTEGLVRGFRWIAQQLHPALPAVFASGANSAAAAPAATTLAALQSHFPSLLTFASPIAAVATNYVDAQADMELSLYPGQSVEVLGIVKERARFVVRIADAAAASAALSDGAAAPAAASAASASSLAVPAALSSVVGLVPFNTLRSLSLNREHDAQMAHVARGSRVEPAQARYVAVGDWEGRGAAVDATEAAAADPASPSSPPSLPTSGELSFPRGSSLLVTRDLGHWLRGRVLQSPGAGAGAASQQSVGAEGLIPAAWVRTAAFVEAQAAEQEAKNNRRQGSEAATPARRGGRT